MATKKITTQPKAKKAAKPVLKTSAAAKPVKTAKKPAVKAVDPKTKLTATGRMPLSAIGRKSELVKKYRSSAKDTGSVSVQVAQLTDRISHLAKHLTKHLHDFDSKRGLLILVGKRRRLLNYLRQKDEKTYQKLVKDLKLKK